MWSRRAMLWLTVYMQKKIKESEMPEFIKRLIHRGEEGFTLVEVIVAMGVFAIALLSIVQVFYYSVSLNVRANQVTTSANLAKREMDTIRLMGVEELDNLIDQVAALTDGTREVDINGDGRNEYELRLDITRSNLGHGEGFLRYVVHITVRPKGWQSGTYIGPPNSYNLRTVILRNTDDND
jgi:prepilin-type N-terminal cleavage/methylation domain-containing protein